MRLSPNGLLLLLTALAAPSAATAAPAQDATPAASAPGQAAARQDDLEVWLQEIETGLTRAAAAAEAGQQAEATRIGLRLYLDHFERLEAYYGPGGRYGVPALAQAVAAGEQGFHELLRASSASQARSIALSLRDQMQRIRQEARAAGVPFQPEPEELALDVAGAAPLRRAARTPEIARILETLDSARASYENRDATGALARIEYAYLEGIELLEPRLPATLVGKIERLIHLTLRPQVSRGAPQEQVAATFAVLRNELLAADDHLAGGSPFWFGAVNSFAVIFREGLEAVLLVGAILAYLRANGADRRYQRQVHTGVVLAILASLATWVAARTLIPISGASRELVEGITGLIAVGVLLYVSHWIFQKVYLHDWKEYLREHAGRAITTGSALAMAGLAFAAVYREGFETVLFYQALLFDSGPNAVLAGFIPGLILILGIGIGIIRLGLRLPLRQVFRYTNAVLLYLAFVFLGKSLYNLQEAGLFSPHPLPWIPDHEAIRQLLGIYPVAETVLAQAVFLALLAGTGLYYRRHVARARQLAPAQAQVQTTG
ncbi:MAG TPA: FTR1 family protein [Longimicrobiales bacterium]|jgi:FTR1 family protein